MLLRSARKKKGQKRRVKKRHNARTTHQFAGELNVNTGGPGGGRPLGASAEFLRPKLVERASKQCVSEDAGWLESCSDLACSPFSEGSVSCLQMLTNLFYVILTNLAFHYIWEDRT